jgi:hypothetical protein
MAEMAEKPLQNTSKDAILHQLYPSPYRRKPLHHHRLGIDDTIPCLDPLG